MPSKSSVYQLSQVMITGTLLLLSVLTGVAKAELFTLFTTPEERQIIDANRYKTEPREARPNPEQTQGPVNQLVREEVSHSYSVTGIAVSGEGYHSAWINEQEYFDGDLVDNEMRLKILVEGKIRVRLTSPDGKHFFATSGETVKATYERSAQAP